MAMSVAILTSGGLDSMTLVAELARTSRRVVPIYVRQGLRWETAERYWLARWLKSFPKTHVGPLVTLALPIAEVYGPHWSTRGHVTPSASDPDEAVYLPGRNLLLTVKAAVYCATHRIPVLALGTLKGNPFPDATVGFRRELSAVLSRGLGRRVAVTAPLADRRKAQLIRRWRSLPFALTFSCINPGGRIHCGRCQKCGERRSAFATARVPDPTTYRRKGSYLLA